MQRLDYETMTKTTLTFNVVVQHPSRISGHSATTTVTITVTDINDNAPKFTEESKNQTVSERESEGFLVTTVMATDADKTTPNNQFRYITCFILSLHLLNHVHSRD